ncbi:hypothetical protein C1H46_008074 [Malus baccata]|uniref:Uncharacterized protein n=1 Tax=Malus baccata TaxID=106549 RepID=A0A540N5I0_MALBA|nr:hypothetical protein C1H46_008074 [Malus baccata]
MDLRSMLVSSNSTESTTVRVSSDKAEWIRIIAFTCSRLPKHTAMARCERLRVRRVAPSRVAWDSRPRETESLRKTERRLGCARRLLG